MPVAPCALYEFEICQSIRGWFDFLGYLPIRWGLRIRPPQEEMTILGCPLAGNILKYVVLATNVECTTCLRIFGHMETRMCV